AAREGIAVVAAGAATWLDAGCATSRSCVVVSTRRLTRIVEHSPADLVATVGAGLPLASLNAELAGAGQWLPLDPPDDGRATVGGVVATGAAGAQAFAYGSPRAFVLGMSVVLSNGRVIKVGGRVVKNVAGYDLCKLFTGSYGTLGLITEITFKLRPRPEREATLVVRAKNLEDSFAAARQLLDGQFLPVAVELHSSPAMSSLDRGREDAPPSLVIRFAGSAQSVASQIERVRSLFAATGTASSVECLDDDAQLWSALAEEAVRGGRELQLRIGALPTWLPEIIQQLERLFDRSGASLMWRASLCAGRLRVFLNHVGAADACADALARLRDEVRRRGGSLVIEKAAGELERALVKLNVDAWGISDASATLMRRIKLELDPPGVLSPGRFFERN
ncbi:MAG: glycolate oxidase binding subunit, partial [Acidobacteriota bacterium]|nr:glycolate oxidase binding subunit [Acidobacteriota bacterium]